MLCHTSQFSAGLAYSPELVGRLVELWDRNLLGEDARRVRPYMVSFLGLYPLMVSSAGVGEFCVRVAAMLDLVRTAMQNAGDSFAAPEIRVFFSETVDDILEMSGASPSRWISWWIA